MNPVSRLGLARTAVCIGVVCLVLAGCPLLLNSARAAVFPDVYSDTQADPDYPDAVASLSGQGFISGFGDGSFLPHSSVTRQQFAKMIVKVMQLTVTGTEVCPFTDVLGGQSAADPLYPDKYVAVCAASGITTGKTGSTFDPTANITRGQLLAMVVRGAHHVGMVLANPGADYFSGTSEDAHFFQTWTDANHTLNPQIAEYNGLLKGIWPDRDGFWDPSANATRGEVAQILWRLQQKLISWPGTATGPGTTTTTASTPSVPGATTIAFGQTLRGSLTVFDQKDTYVFAGNGGDKVLIRLVRGSGTTMWVGLTLRGPDGQQLKDLHNWPTAEIPNITLPSGGTYTIVVYEGHDGKNTGGYCLYVQRLSKPGNAVPLTFGQEIRGSMTSEAQMDTYTFAAKAGDKVDVRMQVLSGIMWAGARVYAPDGTMLAEQRNPHLVTVSALSLSSYGTYTVLAFDGWYGFRLGTYDFTVERE